MLLARKQVEARLRSLSGWERDDDGIEKVYRFAGFDEAMDFVNRVAGLAREADHHPEIKVSYDRVKLSLSTHSEGGVTDKDIELAARIDAQQA